MSRGLPARAQRALCGEKLLSVWQMGIISVSYTHLELAKRADKVVCVEIDSRLLPILDETLGEFDNIRIVNDDVLKVDLHRLIEEEFAGMEVAVCANLPYYITSPILMHLLEEKLPIRSITVMVQKEMCIRDREYAVPILVMCAIGFVLTYIFVFKLGDIVYKGDYAFERSIIAWGTATGVMITCLLYTSHWHHC